MFISIALAEGAQAAPQSTFASFIPIIAILILFYFLMIRPNNKRRKEHKNKLDAMKVNDKVVTSGGVYGKVKKIDTDDVEIEISKDVVIKVIKTTILDVVPKDTK